MKSKKVACLNCEKLFKESFKFCPHCGQQAKDELTIKLLFYNTISNYLSFDGRFFKSFFPLLFKPGYLAGKFIAGKRLLYLHPAKMYLFVTIVFFFLFSFIQSGTIQTIDEELAEVEEKEKILKGIVNERVRDSVSVVLTEKQRVEDSIARDELRKALVDNKYIHDFSETQIDSLVNADDFRKNRIADFSFTSKSVDSLITLQAPDHLIYKEMGLKDDAGVLKRRLYKQGLKLYKSRKGGSLLQTFYDAIPVAMFFLLPIFALILMLFYKKQGVYAHHLVFSFYYFSFLFTVFSLIIGVNFIVDIPNWIDWLIALSTFVYLYLALVKFYKQGLIKTFFKASFTSILFLLFVAPITLFVLGLFAFMFY